MSDQPETIILVYLRRIDAKLDRLAEDVADLKQRMTALEIQVANLAATKASHYGNTSLRIDRIEVRLDRIERRLDLVPTP